MHLELDQMIYEHLQDIPLKNVEEMRFQVHLLNLKNYNYLEVLHIFLNA